MNFDPVEQTNFGLVEGDVLMTEGSGSAETVGTSAVWGAQLSGTVCFQNTLLRLRPRDGVTDGRFLAWWARHAHASGQIAAVSTGANIQHIGADRLKDLRIYVPAVEAQRRIADFLDDRVARIDQIIAARRQQSGLANAHLRSFISALIDEAASTDGQAPLRRFCSGIEQGSSPVGEDRPADEREGSVLKTSAIQWGRFHPRNAKAVPQELADERFRVHDGDVLVVRGSGSADLVGDAATARFEGGKRLYLSDLTYRLRDLSIDPDFATFSIISARGRSELRARVRQGSGPAKARGDDILDLPVPSAPAIRQKAIVQEIRQQRARHDTAADHLANSVALLTEYKQSLITGAVTGELKVTTTSDRGMPR